MWKDTVNFVSRYQLEQFTDPYLLDEIKGIRTG